MTVQPIQSQGGLPYPAPFLGPCLTGLSSLLFLPAASRMITNSLNRDSPPGTPPRRPDTSTSKSSVTVSNKMAAKSAKAAGEGTWAGGGRSWRPLRVGRRHLGGCVLDAAVQAMGCAQCSDSVRSRPLWGPRLPRLSKGAGATLLRGPLEALEMVSVSVVGPLQFSRRGQFSLCNFYFIVVRTQREICLLHETLRVQNSVVDCGWFSLF